MPFGGALTAGIIGAAGTGASAAGGKKAAKHANELAQQQLDIQKGQLNLGNQTLGNASNYWNALLHGGQAAVQATGPYASLIGQAGQGARQSIAAMTPRGGEQNLATAQTFNDTSNNIARLYAGMQPLAAQGLGQIGGLYLGSAGSPSPGAAAGVYGQQLQNAQQGSAGFGNLLYNAMNKLRQGKGAGGGAGIPSQSAINSGLEALAGAL